MSVKKGFTLIELLIVVTILAILVVLTLTSITHERLRAEDAKSKADLNALKIAFENYYNDHSCYPPATWFDSVDDCGSGQLSPYLNSIPCDKKTGLPYVLETDSTTCGWFKLYATFNLPSFDEQARAEQSDTGSLAGNYGVSSSNVTVSVKPFDSLVTPSATISQSPAPSPSVLYSPLPANHDYYWCSEVGNCTSFDRTIETCTPYYIDSPNCDGGTNQCSSVGSCIHF